MCEEAGEAVAAEDQGLLHVLRTVGSEAQRGDFGGSRHA